MFDNAVAKSILKYFLFLSINQLKPSKKIEESFGNKLKILYNVKNPQVGLGYSLLLIGYSNSLLQLKNNRGLKIKHFLL